MGEERVRRRCEEIWVVFKGDLWSFQKSKNHPERVKNERHSCWRHLGWKFQVSEDLKEIWRAF